MAFSGNAPVNYGKGNDTANAGANKGSMAPQVNDSYYRKKALVEQSKERFFGQLANKEIQPKHMGKEIKSYHYLPILDERNVNDQGIDASGATIVDGNLYGSSKDIGTITDKLPTLTENGGRVNRVGMTRIVIRGSVQKFGFFTEYTQESLDFDTDAELKSHMSTEMGKATKEIDEDLIQKDLHLNAGVIRFSGAATSVATITGEGTNLSVFTYNGLRKVIKILNSNRSPKSTKFITGTNKTDTMTVSAARYAYIDDDTRLELEDMKDNFDNQAWIPIKKYGAAGKIATGEVGSIDGVRFIEVPEKMIDYAKGAVVADTNTLYQFSSDGTDDRYDVHSILFVGSGAFTEIGFQATGGKTKFVINSKKPEETADRTDPYGETGFHSIKWYYGCLVLRPEWICKYMGVVKD